MKFSSYGRVEFGVTRVQILLKLQMRKYIKWLASGDCSSNLEL